MWNEIRHGCWECKTAKLKDVPSAYGGSSALGNAAPLWRCSRMRPDVKHISRGKNAIMPKAGRAPTLAISQPLVYALLSFPIA